MIVPLTPKQYNHTFLMGQHFDLDGDLWIMVFNEVTCIAEKMYFPRDKIVTIRDHLNKVLEKAL